MDDVTGVKQTFKAQAKDNGGDWKIMAVGSPQEARSKVVQEAGRMVTAGWIVAGMNRQTITVMHPDNPTRRTEFRVSIVVDDTTTERTSHDLPQHHHPA